MPGKIKNLMMSEYLEKIKGVSNMFLVSYPGLKSLENSELRQKLSENGNSLLHIKNRIFKKALKEAGLSELGKSVDGFSGLVFGEDVLAGVKIVTDFAREFKNIKLKGGYFEGQILSAEDVTELSKIPPREVLLAQLLGTIQAPVTGFVTALNGVMSKFVSTLKEIEKTK